MTQRKLIKSDSKLIEIQDEIIQSNRKVTAICNALNLLYWIGDWENLGGSDAGVLMDIAWTESQKVHSKFYEMLEAQS